MSTSPTPPSVMLSLNVEPYLEALYAALRRAEACSSWMDRFLANHGGEDPTRSAMHRAYDRHRRARRRRSRR